MRTTGRITLFLVVFGISSVAAFAMPDYLEAFRRDPLRRPTVDGCDTCHMTPEGGDARNAFGQAFESGGHRITALLRAQFPDRFAFPISRGAGGAQIHFSDPNGREVVFEAGGTRMVVDVAARSVDGVGSGAIEASGAAAAPQTAGGDVPVDPYAREGAFLGSHIVNLQSGKPMRAGSVDFAIQHRFIPRICVSDCSPNNSGSAGSLFGLDGPAAVAYSGRFGLTDRLSIGFLRTSFFKTIELSSMLNVARQRGSVPVTIAVRAGVEGRRSFHGKNSKFIQPIVTRTFADRVSFTAAPTFAFNTRDEASTLPNELRYGVEHNNTIALGLGAGIRFLRTTSIVGEYIPRLWGYRGEINDRAGVSIGLQKSTFRHTFELAISRQIPMTAAQYAIQGDNAFKLGFNIYRRVR